jgi:NAD(P)-dependent dehydrogenase (short-subunit alcohol dehydrogenase family)
MRLMGRVAIVTGASEGLGHEIAAHYVREGASVLLVARRPEPLLRACEGLARLASAPDQRVESTAGDVASPESCGAIAARAEALFGRVDVLVNNAGVYGPMGRTEDVDWAEWELAIRVNLFGTVSMCRAVLPLLRHRGYGKIITLSGGGATAPLPFISAYAASKAAVVRFSETLAHELAGTRIDVNAIAPGALNTRLLDQVLEAGPERVGEEFHRRALRQRDEGGAPLHRGADLAVFLASSESDGITGRLLSAVWDDWRSLPALRDRLSGSDVFTLRRIVPGDRGWEE